MLDVAILGQVALGYSPFIDRNRTVAATRLTVFPLRPDATLDVAQLLHAVGDVWPASGGNVSLNVVSESLAPRPAAGEPDGQPDGRGAELHGRRTRPTSTRWSGCTAPATRCSSRAARTTSCRARCCPASSTRSSISPTSGASARRRGRRRSGVTRSIGARPVGRAHGRRHGGGVRARRPRRARLADRRRHQRHRGAHRQGRWRSPTCRSSSS